VLFTDLDNFKVVNDSLGHQAGDALLCSVAERLRACLREGDTPARLGGDEFTALLESISDEAQVVEVAERFLAALREPIQLEGREVFVTASVGIAQGMPGDRAEDVLRNADLALYGAKGTGKARHAVFDRGMERRVVQRLELETALRRALERGELDLLYQPIVSLQTEQAEQEVVEVEALLRWRQAAARVISPGEFIPLAEETGLIVPIGDWVLREACREARRWHERYPHRLPVSVGVNLSARQLLAPDLPAKVAEALAETGLAPHLLKLEITESAVMHDADAAIRILQELRELGVQLAIDDFGTGYSSLSYLKRFPVDTLKIDRSFVDGLGEDAQDTAIVRSVVALAQTLDLSLTAEGVETAQQEMHLRMLGCDRAQGFRYAGPLRAAEMDALLARQAALPAAA
jgi:diguanylate cyclase (GGDEF)-like protein